MRKLLLASAALAFSAGGASAATFGQQDPTAPASGISPGVCCATPRNAPDPGKVVVHMDGAIWIDAGYASANVDRGEAGTPNADAKNQPYGMSGFARLYFGVDGQTMNGLKYGGHTEIRTDFPGSPPGGFTVTSVYGQPSSNSTATLLYFRRAYVYLAGDSWGLLRIGQGDGPVGIFNQHAVTTGEAFDLGGWDGDAPDFFGNAALAWPFLDTGNEYDSNKITYVSPTLGTGFSFGVSFAPSSSNASANSGSNAASGSFDRQSSSTLASDLARGRNFFEVAADYKGPVFGGVTTDSGIGYLGSGVVNNATIGGVQKFEGVSAGDLGLSFSYAGATLFGHVYAGQMDGSMAPLPKIVGRHKDGLAWVAGPMYSTGPWTMGASYYVFESEGSAGGTGNRMERGLDLGGNYNITKGIDLYASLIYGTRYQRGVNFIDPAGTATEGNRTVARGLVASIVVGW